MIFIKINPNKKRNILVVFDDVIAEMLSNKKFHPIVTEIFIRDRKLNISLKFYTLLYCTKRYYGKFYTLVYYENSKQTRSSTSCI